jgi:hypothetical protein
MASSIIQETIDRLNALPPTGTRRSPDFEQIHLILKEIESAECTMVDDFDYRRYASTKVFPSTISSDDFDDFDSHRHSASTMSLTSANFRMLQRKGKGKGKEKEKEVPGEIHPSCETLAFLHRLGVQKEDVVYDAEAGLRYYRLYVPTFYDGTLCKPLGLPALWAGSGGAPAIE